MTTRTQVITIHPDGRIEGLQRKTGDGLDLRRFGHVSIKRTSEVLWSEEEQKWKIRLLCVPYLGEAPIVTETLYKLATTLDSLPKEVYLNSSEELLVPEYEQAVEIEIAIMDGLRQQGLL